MGCQSYGYGRRDAKRVPPEKKGKHNFEIASSRIRINKSSPFFTSAFLRGKVIFVKFYLAHASIIHTLYIHVSIYFIPKKQNKANVLFFIDVSAMLDAFSEG